jgi:hypothetical protein
LVIAKFGVPTLFASNALSMIPLAVVLLLLRRTTTVTAGAPASGSDQRCGEGAVLPGTTVPSEASPVRFSVYLLPASVL